VSEKGLEPLGASKPAWKLVADLATALGYEANWTKLKQVRAELTGGGAAGADASATVPGALGAE
jgi:hypothetical protein